MKKLHTLLVTNLFPNPEEPTRGIFVSQMAAGLKQYTDLTVVSPLPWFPKVNFLRAWTRWYRFAWVPRVVRIGDMEVHYPKFFVIPKAGFLQSISLFIALLPLIHKLHRAHPIDCINVHWAFPDGVAVSWAARILRIPFVLTAHGCDINSYLNMPLRRVQIISALKHAERVTVVSRAIQSKLAEAGMTNGQVNVIGNGIDPDLFSLQDKASCRKRIGIPQDKKIVLFVGQFVEVKGFIYLLQAAKEMQEQFGDDFGVYAVGDGPLREGMMKEAFRLGLETQVIFPGPKPYAKIPLWMGACDVFCMPSLSEGHPCVALEALACGRPVAATRVGGLPEVIHAGNGRLCVSGDSHKLAEMLCEALGCVWNEKQIAASMVPQTWDNAARRYYDEIQTAVRTYPKTLFRREIVTVAAEPKRREAPRTRSGTQAEGRKGAGRQARLQQEEGFGIGSKACVRWSPTRKARGAQPRTEGRSPKDRGHGPLVRG